ncbi:hypothetical protein ATM17_21550 [Sphingopyxis macrogoltabida]|uniref:Uncharacterized protein n=1 Tax=Sphingopyxis macrogoltabida TaxID=33050 RepID=A0AAC9AX26_SPHMC|nr:hypothetical protein ATM17_21550 [Sphingopyxis macrogoltabida]
MLSGSRLSPIERQMGRLMRSPDEHTDDTTAPAADPPATTALGDAAAAEDTAAEDTADKTDVTDGDKGDADKANGDDKSGDEAADSIIGAPEAYDVAAFTMPEGVEFDAEMFELVQDDLKTLNLSQKGAESIVGLFASKIAPKIEERAAKAMDTAAATLSADLARDLQADPEVGGAKLRESQAYAAKAIARFIPDAAARSEFSTFLNESGLGNHPLLTRVIAGAGRALSEASTPAAEAEKAERSEAQKFYG